MSSPASPFVSIRGDGWSIEDGGDGRLWLTFVDDPEAARIVHRRSTSDDPLACALDELAAAVAGTGVPAG